MKHGRHASEYEKVRRAAGMARPKFDIDDDDLAAATAKRIEEFNDDFRQRMAKLSEHEHEQAARRKAEADALSSRANVSAMLKEYQQHGVEPPFTKPDGSPKFSLGFLLKIGWDIMRVGEKNVLVSPIAAKGK